MCISYFLQKISEAFFTLRQVHPEFIEGFRMNENDARKVGSERKLNVWKDDEKNYDNCHIDAIVLPGQRL